jgi:hypothetical protein
MMWLIRCFWVNVSDQQSLEYDVGPLARARLGSTKGGCEGASWSTQTLGSLRVAQVFRMSSDMVARVPTLVLDQDVEH